MIHKAYIKNKSFSRQKTLGELSTDSEQCCQDCGSVGHTKGRCTCDIVTIKFGFELGINSIELMEEKKGWKRGSFMSFSQKHKAFIIKQFMPPGKHIFKFLINGTEWRLNDAYPVTDSVKGRHNNFMIVEPINYQAISIISQDYLETNNMLKVRIYLPLHSFRIMLRELNLLIKSQVEVKIHGSWDNWVNGKEMQLETDLILKPEYYYTDIDLPIGTYEYKFTIDGKWIFDPFRSVKTTYGCLNHYIDLNTIIKKNKKISMPLALKPDIKLSIVEIKIASLELFRIYGHSMNVLGSKIWIFGGCFQSSFLGSMIVINPQNYSTEIFQVTDREAPEQLGFHRTFTYGSKILMFGGHNEASVLDKYSTFDTINRSWTTYSIRQMPPKREMFSLNHKLKTPLAYLFGGYYCSQNLEHEQNFNDFYALHLDNMYFEKLVTTNAPDARCHHTAEFIQSNLYLFGGMQISGDNKTCFNDLYVINTDNHNSLVWKKIETEGQKPCPRYGHIMLKLGNQFIVHGGTNVINNNTSNIYLWDLWVFNTINRSWIAVPIDGDSERLGRAFHAGCIYDGSIIIYGGKFKNRYDKHRLVN